MVQTTNVCECLEGEMDLIPYARLKRGPGMFLFGKENSGPCFAWGKKIWDPDSGQICISDASTL